MSAISTHVLDIAVGRPVPGMPVRLERVASPGQLVAAAARQIAIASTDADGRIASLGPDVLPAGTYRLVFDTGGYLTRQQPATGAADAGPFFPEVTVTFTVVQGEHYHVPLLMSPFGYSTYRGS